MRIAITGATGLVGQALSVSLESSGHEVIRLVRKVKQANDLLWDAQQAIPESLGAVDAFIHLAGTPIAEKRWTAKVKDQIYSSRVNGTTQVAEYACRTKLPLLISASAIGYYGDTADTIATEAHPAGEGYLAKVCKDWEAATEPAESQGTRVIRLRIGIVLDTEGGALAKMLPIFRLGLGGPLGSGKQYMSWIALSDVLAIIRFCLTAPISGPVNAVAPQAMTNRDFTRILARALKRPALIPAPAFGLRLILGEMADALLLQSTRVSPEALLNAHYRFLQPELKPALMTILNAAGRK